jgi:hypothetical protein
VVTTPRNLGQERRRFLPSDCRRGVFSTVVHVPMMAFGQAPMPTKQSSCATQVPEILVPIDGK